jgi:hypothetical protein
MVPTPLRVTVEIRALDVEPRLERVWRLSRDVSAQGVRLQRELPFEANRPVALSFRFPDGEQAFAATGRVVAVAPEREEVDGEQARPRAVRFTDVSPDSRAQLDRYLEERKRP